MKKYSEVHCEELMDHCKGGKSLESYCATVGVTPGVIAQWYSEYPAFKQVVEMAPCLELLFWEKKLIESIEQGQEDFVNVIKSRIDNLMKNVISPIKSGIYHNLKEDDRAQKIKNSDDLLTDYKLLMD